MAKVTTYQVRGEVPAKRHTQAWRDGRLLAEEVVGLEGFDGRSSTLYHLHSPMRLLDVGPLRPIERSAWSPASHVHRRFDGHRVPEGGDAVSARGVLAWNDDVEVALARPDTAMDGFYRNAEGDELIFVHEGEGTLHTMFGDVAYRRGDYLVIPRGVTYRFAPSGAVPERHLVIVAATPIEVPERYRNRYGQLTELAPFSNRDLRVPEALVAHDETGEFSITIRVRRGLQELVVPTHPFDVVGWDGYLFPYALNVDALEPYARAVHAPPPIHQTFEAAGIAVCTFRPRPLDWHPEAVPIPYNHANLDSEELIYYVDGDFSSRRGVEAGSLTLHPTGLTHGPQPGVAEASLGGERTDETAVMLDAFRPLHLGPLARALDDPSYAWSWSERSEPVVDELASPMVAGDGAMQEPASTSA